MEAAQVLKVDMHSVVQGRDHLPNFARNPVPATQDKRGHEMRRNRQAPGHRVDISKVGRLAQVKFGHVARGSEIVERFAAS